MTQAKNIRVRIETFNKLKIIQKAAKEFGKQISLGVVIDDLCEISSNLPYAGTNCAKALNEMHSQLKESQYGTQA